MEVNREEPEHSIGYITCFFSVVCTFKVTADGDQEPIIPVQSAEASHA